MSRSHDALIGAQAGPTYEGAAGQTRTRRVHVRGPDGSFRSVELFVSVNAATHPDIAATALAGELHGLTDGRTLALPFVYHDPAARKLLLVVPEALAHLELQAWADVMADIASDTDHPVPAYVRAGRSVLGLAALHAALDDDEIEPSDAELEEVGRPEIMSSGRWHEVAPSEATSVPAPIDDSEVESVPPDA